jgi:predicted secreted protein
MSFFTNGRIKECAALVLAGAASMTLTGCATPPAEPPPVVTPMINGPNGTDHATVVKGDTVTVRLPTQMGAALAWRLTPESAENAKVTLESRKPQQPVSAGRKSSGAAFDVFVFRAKHSGATTIEMIYDRPFNPDAPPIKRFKLDLDITK